MCMLFISLNISHEINELGTQRTNLELQNCIFHTSLTLDLVLRPKCSFIVHVKVYFQPTCN